MNGFGWIRLASFVAMMCCCAVWPVRSEEADQDGSRSAPAGPAQYPALLEGYAARPPWRVAGVDYAVGVSPGTALKVPTASNLPEGVSLQKGPALYVGGNDVTLSGYDLTRVTVMIMDGAKGTVTISNCAATAGVNIRSTVGATANLVVQNCSLDGGGLAADPDFQLIKVWCPLTVKYSVIKRAPGGIYARAPLTVLYSLLEGFGINGGHANAIYVIGRNNPADSTRISYNTIYSGAARTEEYPVTGLGAAIAFFGDGGSFYSSTVANNTIVSALPGAASYLMGYYVGGDESATGGDVRDNYFASVNGFNRPKSGAFGPFYRGSKGRVEASYSGNIDMNTGHVLFNAEGPVIRRDGAR
jgi:hypothetical protein